MTTAGEQDERVVTPKPARPAAAVSEERDGEPWAAVPSSSVVAVLRSSRVHPFLESRPGMIGLGLIGFWVLVALLAPWVTGYGPNAQDASAMGSPTPSAAHILGADHLGRDLWSRIAYGARTVLILAPAALLSAYVVGCAIGMVAAYFGGWIDVLLSRASDVILSFPVIILYVIIITSIGPSAFNIVLAIVLASAPAIGRLARGIVLELRTKEYVDAARLRGEGAPYIMIVELLPNAREMLILDACLRMGYTIIKIGVLGFLGLGVPPPDPDWGRLVKETTTMILVWPHMAVFPCLAITSLVIGFNLLADGLRETWQRGP